MNAGGELGWVIEHAVHPAAQAEGGGWRNACWTVGVNHVEPFNQKPKRKSERYMWRENIGG